MTARQGVDWRLLGVVYALVAAAFVARAVLSFNNGTPLLSDTDDAMRLVVVRDLLGGQGWYDIVQHRLNAPFGAEMHWSRLADLPMAALVLLLSPLLGAAYAETAAAVLVPLILLFILLYLSGRVALVLVGREGLLPAFVLPAFSLSVLGEFGPGRIDHHSLQILLAMTMLWCAVESLTRPRFALGAGIAAATALAIGVEGVPAVAAAILAFGLMWVADPARTAALRGFGVSFALAAVVHLAIALPPARWFVAACDAMSITYAAAAVAVGAAFLLLSLLKFATSLWLRFAAGIGAGAMVAVILAGAFPQCLRGPYAMLDPWLVEHWIDRIREAKPLWESLLDDPVYPLGILVPPLVALAAALWHVTRDFLPARGEHREAGKKNEWLTYLCFLVLAVAAMLLQIRASRLATVIAIPAGAWLIVAARHYYLERKSLPRIAPLLVSWIASAGLAVALIASIVVGFFPSYAESIADPARTSKNACLLPAAFTDLAALPESRVMAPIDLGAHLLAYTPHAVVAAPYHRNEQGVRDTFDFFNGPIAAARDILERRNVTLVVVCPPMPELSGLPDAAPDSFVRLYASNELPAWLVETTSPDATLRVFTVTPR